MRSFTEILSDRIANDPKLSESGLATAAGLDNSTIRQMLKFDRSPRIDTAMKICRALGVTLEDFFAEDANPARSEISMIVNRLSQAELALLLNAARGLHAPYVAKD